VSVVLALLAAACYGVSDFLGGLASRRRTALAVLLYSYPVGAVLMAVLLPLAPGQLTARAVAFGVLGGGFGLMGVALLYRLMTVAAMNVVSPITAVLAAAVPVAAGVLTGDRPAVAAWAGVAIGLVAVVLVSRQPADAPHGPFTASTFALAILSGVGFGGYFVFLARAGDGTGLWPLLVSRLTSAVLIVPLAYRAGAVTAIRGRLLVLCLVAGALDAGANLFFLLAARQGLLSLAGVITALYPAATVALAVAVLHERPTGWQRVGLGLAAVAVVLITAR
jgi:drug/metabolite transporter (DMT)-like permease